MASFHHDNIWNTCYPKDNCMIWTWTKAVKEHSWNHGVIKTNNHALESAFLLWSLFFFHLIRRFFFLTTKALLCNKSPPEWHLNIFFTQEIKKTTSFGHAKHNTWISPWVSVVVYECGPLQTRYEVHSGVFLSICLYIQLWQSVMKEEGECSCNSAMANLWHFQEWHIHFPFTVPVETLLWEARDLCCSTNNIA